MKNSATHSRRGLITPPSFPSSFPSSLFLTRGLAWKRPRPSTDTVPLGRWFPTACRLLGLPALEKSTIGTDIGILRPGLFVTLMKNGYRLSRTPFPPLRALCRRGCGQGPFVLAMSPGFFGFYAHIGALVALEAAGLLEKVGGLTHRWAG